MITLRCDNLPLTDTTWRRPKWIWRSSGYGSIRALRIVRWWKLWGKAAEGTWTCESNWHNTVQGSSSIAIVSSPHSTECKVDPWTSHHAICLDTMHIQVCSNSTGVSGAPWSPLSQSIRQVSWLANSVSWDFVSTQRQIYISVILLCRGQWRVMVGWSQLNLMPKYITKEISECYL